MNATIPVGLVERAVLALARESHGRVAISRGAGYVDYSVALVGPLGTTARYLIRLFGADASDDMLRDLREEADALGAFACAVCPQRPANGNRAGLTVIDGPLLTALFANSAMLSVEASGIPQVDREGLAELRDAADARMALLNGLAFLRPLSRYRIPQPLRWTRITADDLFERSFFLVMLSTHHLRGESWGAQRRGVAIPDGVLEMPDAAHPVLYDCKAAGTGYKMSHRDVIAFADYIQNPPANLWQPPAGVTPRFLIVSSGFREGTGKASFAGRERLLADRVPGARLCWIRAPDLSKFSIAVERARVRPLHRAQIDWTRLLDHGNVRWTHFAAELADLETLGYEFDIPEA